MPPSISGATPRPSLPDAGYPAPRPAVMPGLMPQYDQGQQQVGGSAQVGGTAPATLEDVGQRLTSIEEQLRRMQSMRQPTQSVYRPAVMPQQQMPYNMNSLFGGIRGLF